MRVLVAGATGVLGRPLVALLSSVGHDVIAAGRPSPRASAIERAGAKFVQADPLDRGQVFEAMRQCSPDAVVDLLTAIPAAINPRRMTRDFELTNRLRREGTRHLLDAAQESGVSRMITQGIAFCYEPGVEGPADEDALWWQQVPRQFQTSLSALAELESRTRDAGGLVLRLGHLYGPGSAFAANGSIAGQIRSAKLPVVGAGTSTFSFVHAEDAAAAIVAALDKEVIGALNIVDDDPSELRDWVTEMARLLDAPEPKRVPVALARMAAGSWGAAFMSRLRGADNSRATLTLDWRPRYSSWREGFAAELGS